VSRGPLKSSLKPSIAAPISRKSPNYPKPAHAPPPITKKPSNKPINSPNQAPPPAKSKNKPHINPHKRRKNKAPIVPVPKQKK
jgi:hypothetical protein